MDIKSFLFSFGSLVVVAFAAPDFSQIGFSTLGGGTTGGAGGTVVRVSTVAELKQYAEDVETPYVIVIEGEINTGIAVKIDSTGAVNSSGSISTTYGEQVLVGNNKTIVGIGSGAFLNRVGLFIQKKHNIIIRNIKITMSDVPISKTDENKVVAYRNGAEVILNDPDCISISADSGVSDWAGKSLQASYNIWVDHCEFYNAYTSDKDRYDGLLDAKNNIYNATVSWNYFHNHHKGSLIGNSNGDSLRHEITFHHNYYKAIDARQPMMRHSMSHLYNNYIEGDDGSGNGPNVRYGSDLYIESNHYASLSKAVFGGDDDAYATIVNNKYEGCATFMSSGCGSKTMRISLNPGASLSISDTSNVAMDDDIPRASFKPSSYYSYTVDDVKSIVTTYAGIGKINTDEYTLGGITDPVISSSAANSSSSVAESSSSKSLEGIAPGANALRIASVFVHAGKIYVRGSANAPVSVFNSLGFVLYKGYATETESSLQVNLPKGIYLVQVGRESIRITLK